ncbi:hypothetical protein A9Q78_02920 [Methylophaga sp. 41_12_T18]|nr:hypothetical protein A9Q78_02920 [Methylophaga sp. 41_12_T18]
MEQLHFYLEMATFVVTIIGLPVAIISYFREQHALRDEREYGTYDVLDDKYIELQQLCLDHPRLDIFDTPFHSPNELDEGEQKQQEAILLIRISIFERAYLMYQRSTRQGKANQWLGWEVEINEWLERENFLTVWLDQKEYYDQEFVKYFDANISQS